jgi:hypothetical protein
MISARKDFRSPVKDPRLIEPETLLPVQFCDSMYRPLTPEKRLVIAILADALICFQRYRVPGSRRARRESTEAECWLMSADRQWPFSFENICDVLSLEAKAVRCVVRTWRERQEGSNPEAAAEELATVLTLLGHWGH